MFDESNQKRMQITQFTRSSCSNNKTLDKNKSDIGESRVRKVSIHFLAMYGFSEEQQPKGNSNNTFCFKSEKREESLR